MTLRRAESENRRFLVLFSKADDLEDVRKRVLKRNEGPLAVLLEAALERIDASLAKSRGVSSEETGRPLKLSAIERTVQSAIQDEMGHQERYIHLLATIGNTSPFVGLFGTVWGIMGAFQEIGRQGTANIAVVAPGVAEALVNTAAGLFVAIPAVVAYNIFVNKLTKMHVQMEVFASEVITLAEEKTLLAPDVQRVK
jgi:biopolymer transport protein TolQ